MTTPEKSKGNKFRENKDDDGIALRDFSAERLIRFLNTSKINLPGGIALTEILKDKEKIKHYILSLDFSNFVELIVAINALVRNKKGNDKWEMDGEGVMMGGQNIFPDFQDKKILLNKTLDVAREMAMQGRSTEDISLLLAVLITAIHPFMNGNGRTAKFLLTMMNAGYDAEVIKKVLTSDKFSNSVNASLFQSAAYNILDPDGKLINEEFDKFVEQRETRKKVVEIIIDIFKNDEVTLGEFKKVLRGAVDPELYDLVFKSL